VLRLSVKGIVVSPLSSDIRCDDGERGELDEEVVLGVSESPLGFSRRKNKGSSRFVAIVAQRDRSYMKRESDSGSDQGGKEREKES
jgi:hypothetical protein